MIFGERIIRFFIGLDQALNPIIYGGSEDVTVSAQAAFRELVLNKSHRTRRFIDWFFAILGDENHCFDSLRKEIDEFPTHRELILLLLEERIERLADASD